MDDRTRCEKECFKAEDQRHKNHGAIEPSLAGAEVTSCSTTKFSTGYAPFAQNRLTDNLIAVLSLTMTTGTNPPTSF